jgi:hypothetical protein
VLNLKINFLLSLHLKNQSNVKGLRETKKNRNLALQEMQGYQWDSHHQHHAPAQAYPTAKQMEGKDSL